MIPKIIHYIWLGKGEKPKIFKQCFDSWKKFCPDYQFMLWDESNVDLDCCAYVREAYDAKKYAFASDVIRLQKLYEYGGIYLDIDVELLKPIDEFLNEKCFMGFEAGGLIAPGLIIGAEKGNDDFSKLIEIYKTEKFKNNGKLNLLTVCERLQKYYSDFGLKREDKFQKLSNLTVYPTEYFCPINIITGKKRITKKTYSIHWYYASWYSPWQRFKKTIKQSLNFVTFGVFGKILVRIKRVKK